MTMTLLGRLFGSAAPRRPDRARDVATVVCSMARGRRRALDLVRIVHFAQVLQAGEHGSTILSAPFESTAMGPMSRPLHDALRREIARPSGADQVRTAKERLGDLAVGSLRRAVATTFDLTSVQLLAAVQAPGSAWAERFAPDAYGSRPISDPTRHSLPRRDVFRGAEMRIEHLAAEYRARFATPTAAARQA